MDTEKKKETTFQENQDEACTTDGRRRKKGSIGLKVAVAVLILLLAAAVFILVLFFYLRGKGTFLKNTTLNGYDVSEKTPQEVLPLLEKGFQNVEVVLKERGETDLTGSLESLGIYVDKERTLNVIGQALEVQNSNPFEILSSLLWGRSIYMDVPSDVDEEVFSAMVCAEKLLIPRKKCKDAKLIQEKNGDYKIRPEVYGTEFADEDLQYEIRSEIGKQLADISNGDSPVKEGKLEINFPERIYRLPQIYETDPELIQKKEVYNAYCHAEVVYQFGSKTKTLGWDTVRKWLVMENGGGRLDKDMVWEYVTKLADKYDTRFHDRVFQKTWGGKVTIPASLNEYGYTIDRDAEFSQLMTDLSGNARVCREPVYVLQNEYNNPVFYHREGVDDLAGTYVEASLSEQHLWFYKNGSLYLESDFVSGCVAKGTETQTGAFPLAYKKSPDILVGSNANDGYETEVQYWMPFYEGQGLHDADWRGAFGGSIYQYDGSHGCINLPPWAAAEIYQVIEPGTAIIIYK